MHIIFQFKLFLGETKSMEIIKVCTFSIFLFERIGDKNNIGVQ